MTQDLRRELQKEKSAHGLTKLYLTLAVWALSVGTLIGAAHVYWGHLTK